MKGAVESSRLLTFRSRNRRTRLLQELQRVLRRRKVGETRRAEKDYRVLNALTPKARQRLLIFGEDAQTAPIRTIQELGVFVSERCFRKDWFLVLCHE